MNNFFEDLKASNLFHNNLSMPRNISEYYRPTVKRCPTQL